MQVTWVCDDNEATKIITLPLIIEWQEYAMGRHIAVVVVAVVVLMMSDDDDDDDD